MEKVQTLARKPNEELVWIETVAKYSFHNPDSANGPFGHFNLSIFSNKSVFGKMEIDTVWALGTKNSLTLKGSYTIIDNHMIIETNGYGTETNPVFIDGKRIVESHNVEFSIDITLYRDLTTGNINFHGNIPETSGNKLPIRCKYIDSRYPF